jgi:tetratricopeptide (TPR) repeat protein
MTKKKHLQTPALQEGDAQAQQALVQYHQIANNLRASQDRPQAETALVEINNVPEGVQIALLKELAKENHVDAADVLIALNALSPLKSVRKEAKRSLIRLEGVKIRPDWQPPIERTPAIGAIQLSTNPPRFWKCLVTDSRDIGEVQLLCCWEQGDNYKDVRVLGFLLEFWSQGVKDFFTMVESKRGFERFVAEVAAEMLDAPMKDCSLAKARRLLQEALDIHKKRGIPLPKDYRFNLALINQLILEAPDLDEEDEDDEESEERDDLHGLSPEDVVSIFLEAWTDDEDYETAYDLLSLDSPLREGLSRDEWIDRRGTWATRVAPFVMELDFCYERSLPELEPNSSKNEQEATQKEVEAGWSIELDKELFSPDDAPPELPFATAVYEESGRHWFWSSYTLVQENDDWRIQSMTDEGLKAQELSTDELQKKIRGFDEFREEFKKTHTLEEIKQHIRGEKEPDYVKEIIRQAILVNCYVDVLDKRMRLEPSVYEDVVWRMFGFGQYERCLTYLIPLAQRFPEKRGLYLRDVAQAQLRLSEQYLDKDDDDEERADRCVALAEEALRESLLAENNFETHIDLAELLIGIEERLEEAEDHLQQARQLISSPQDEAKIESNLGGIAKQRGQHKEALSHYQRVVELLPEESEAWADLAQTHQKLGNLEEAETNYKQAIAVEPREVYYFTLSELYKENDQFANAIKILEEGLAANPDSAILHAYVAVTYLNSGDYNQAEMYLDKAEEIDSELDVIPTYRALIALRKLEQMEEQTSHKPSKPLKRKGRGR